MIRAISNLIEDQFEKIQVDTIYRAFRIAIWVLSMVYVISLANSLYTDQVKIRNSLILVLIALGSIGILMWIKRQVSKPKQQLKWFYIVVLAYTFLVAFTSPGKYMTTVGIALAFFTPLVYLLFSYKMLIIHGAITGLLFLIYSVSGVGKIVTLGLGYVFSVLGAYGLMVITLLIGVKTYHQIKAIYDQQLLDLNGKNDELNALNEEYYATDELLRFNMEHDALTGIMNWQGFVNQVNEMLRQGRDHDFYVVYLDLDDFMHINNAFGYAFGDEVLKQLVRGFKVSRIQ